MLRLPRAVESCTGDTASQDARRTALENRGRNRGVDEMMQAQKRQTLIQLAQRRRQAYVLIADAGAGMYVLCSTVQCVLGRVNANAPPRTGR